MVRKASTRKRSNREAEFSEEVVDVEETEVSEPTAEVDADDVAEAPVGPSLDEPIADNTPEPEPGPEDSPSPVPADEPAPPPVEVDVDAEIAAICHQHQAVILVGPVDVGGMTSASGRRISSARAAQLKSAGGFTGVFYKLDNGMKVFVNPDKTIWRGMGLPQGLDRAFWRPGPNQADGTPGPTGWFYYHRDAVEKKETGWKKVEDFPKWQNRHILK